MRRLFHTHPLPPTPTQALPGTPEKVAVLRERARLGQALWHPLDAALPTAAALAPTLAAGADELLEVA
jgi:hypothetical protein